MSERAFELLLAVVEELVFQLEVKGIISGAEILQLVAAARREARR